MKYLEFLPAYHEHLKKFGINPSIDEVALIFPYLEKKTFRKGEIILKQGEICNEIYFITKGLARSYNILPNGKENTYIICRENNSFTEHCSLMFRKPSNDFLEAIEATEALCITHENLFNLYKKHQIWETIGRKISDKNYIVSIFRLKSLMNDDSEHRYKRYLKSFQNILDRIPQNIAASYLGITPQSFSRLKRELGDSIISNNVVISNQNHPVKIHEITNFNDYFEKNTPEIIALFEYLKNLIKTINTEDLMLLLPFVKHKIFKKGECLAKVGEISQHIFFNIKGIGRNFIELPNGTEKTYFIITEHTIFSDYASVTSQTPATENIEALVDMEVFCLYYPDLLKLYEKHPIWVSIGRLISDFNFAFSQNRLRSMMNDDASTRYENFIKFYKNISHQIPQQVIASYLGITPQSLSRLKKEMDVL